MNKQEIFETVAKHLFDQGKPSFNDEKKLCLYRADDGCKCAIGKLIPDDNYDAKMENMSASGISNDSRWTLPREIFCQENLYLLNTLQGVHDRNLEHHSLPNNWISTEIMREALADSVAGLDLNVDFINDLSFKDR